MSNEFEKDTLGASEELVSEAAAEEIAEAPVEEVSEVVEEAAEAVEPAAELPVLEGSFTVGQVRARAKKALKGNYFHTLGRILVAYIICFIPSLLVYALGLYKVSSSANAGKIIEIIALIIPLIIGGPLTMGCTKGMIDIDRGKKFTFKTLFFAFSDSMFLKSLGAYILFSLISSVVGGILQLPALGLRMLANALDQTGFAYTGTIVLSILFGIAGAVAALIVCGRIAMVFPLLADNPKLKVMTAFKISFSAMKGNCVKYGLAILSYMGWYLLSYGVIAAILGITAFGGYAYIMSAEDFFTMYMRAIIGIMIFYAIGYVLFVLATATFMARPYGAIAAMYDILLGYEGGSSAAIDDCGAVVEDAVEDAVEAGEIAVEDVADAVEAVAEETEAVADEVEEVAEEAAADAEEAVEAAVEEAAAEGEDPKEA